MCSGIFPAIFTSVSYSKTAVYFYAMSGKCSESEPTIRNSSLILDDTEALARNNAVMQAEKDDKKMLWSNWQRTEDREDT